MTTATQDIQQTTIMDSNGSVRPKVALITGINGQDGSFLAELLLSKHYEVHGIIRRASTFNTSRIEHLYADPMSHTEGCGGCSDRYLPYVTGHRPHRPVFGHDSVHQARARNRSI